MINELTTLRERLAAVEAERDAYYKDMVAGYELAAMREFEAHKWQNRAEAAERFREGDWCDECHAPQWVLPDGSHDCLSISVLRSRLAAVEAERDALRPVVRAADVWRSAFLFERMEDTKAARRTKEDAEDELVKVVNAAEREVQP